MNRIAPSILSMDFLDLRKGLETLNEFGVDVLHLDIMDGAFVPNISFGPCVIKSLSKAFDGLLEAHLMIETPENYIEDFVKAGCNRIIVHAESTKHLHRLIQQIKSLGVQAGIAINPATPLSVLEEIVSEIDLILFMSVNPGFGGQSFIQSVGEKIKKAQNFKKINKNLIFEVDGGVNQSNIKEIFSLGIDLAVMGSAIFNKNDVAQNLELIQKEIKCQ
ncbi:MAG: ribulose-phosphate 3-epimerase [Candidatus Cloacimonadota bacterium]|nr:MAG: ribulose-phosphate 3-epimerase [Candidatus Cloacimonadota bacterium]